MEKNIWDAIELIKKAWRENRTIVPLVGAGISADSGIPIVRSIVRYFGKFQQMIEHGAYFDSQVIAPAGRAGEVLSSHRELYKREPWRFVRRFGWPDRFQLNQDLLDLINERQEETIPSSVAEAAQRGIESALKHINPSGAWNLSELAIDVIVETILSRAPALKSLRSSVRREVEAFQQKYSQCNNPGCEARVRKQLTDELGKLRAGRGDTGAADFGAVAENIFRRFQTHKGSSVPFDVAGDWKRLIQYFTNYQGDYADGLITRLCADRGPSLGHQFLAFLCRLVGSKLIMTYNFDDLIERSLIAQGVTPRIFGLEEGVRLPPETLVRDSVSVFKLHGNNHALLLDERVDHPLSATYKDRFDALVGKNPLLLIVGCSGGDMRVRDLFRHVTSAERRRAGAGAIWFHFEKHSPRCVLDAMEDAASDLKCAHEHVARTDGGEREAASSQVAAAEEATKGILPVRTNNPGADLMHIYTALSGRHPAAGSTPYPVHLTRPSPLPETMIGGRSLDGESKSFSHTTVEGQQRRKSEPIDEHEWEKLIAPQRRAAILSTLNEQPPDTGSRLPQFTASQELLAVADHWLREGYQVVWVDLESVHTIAGIAGSILDQCRAYDIQLAPSVLPDKDANAVASAVTRVAHALERSRYFVVLDGLETYPWGPLTHHGDTHQSGRNKEDVEKSLLDFMVFFYQLARQNKKLGESRIWLGVDLPKPRNKEAFGPDKTRLGNIVLGQFAPGDSDELKEAFRRVRAAKDACGEACGNPTTVRTAYTNSNALNHLAMMPLQCLFSDVSKTLADANDVPNNPAFSAFVLHYLACFRRTRNLATLRHVLGVLFGRDAATRRLDLFLRDMTGIPGLGITRLSGGGVWFDRATRDRVYTENSRHASTDELRNFFREAVPANASQVIIQLFLLATTHQRISRSYHNRAFVQSRDCFAFLEYTYHRISSIRYLAKLIAVVEHLSNRKDLVGSAFLKCGDFLRQAIVGNKSDAAFDDLLALMELSSTKGRGAARARSGLNWSALLTTGVMTDLPQLLASLRERHTWELRCLYRGWVRAEQELREQIPAQQLLLWCDRLINEELDHRLNCVVIDYTSEAGAPICWDFRNKTPAGISPHTSEGGVNSDAVADIDAVAWVEAFRSFLLDLQIKLHVDRTDYKTALDLIEERRRRLQTASPLRIVHSTLDEAACYLRTAYRDSDVGISGGPALKECDDKLKDAEKVLEENRENIAWLENNASATLQQALQILKPNGQPSVYDKLQLHELASAATDWHEGWLRCEHLRAEWYLQNISVFAIGFNALPLPDPRNPRGEQIDAGFRECDNLHGRPEEAKNSVDLGLLSYRPQMAYGGKGPRSTLIERSVDGTVYPVYRSIFYTLFGRLDWQLRWANDAHFLDSQRNTADATFEAVYRDFEMARGGLGTENRLLLAINEIYFVEASLVHARVHLARGTSDVNKSISLAAAKHEAARYALQRARNHLLAGRRNVAWWRFYYLMTAQYHAERLTLQVGRNPAEVDLPAQLTRLRRGYNAVRNALDYTLPSSGGVKSQWLTRAWAEMTLAGTAIGCSQFGGKAGLEYVVAQIKWLNERERVLNDEGFKNLLAHDLLRKATEFIAATRDFTQCSEGLRGWARVIASHQ